MASWGVLSLPGLAGIAMAVLLPGFTGLAAPPRAPETPSETYLRKMDELSATWSLYKHDSIADGRVIERDEGGVTTSEAQSYAMLRAVWSNDLPAFREIWRWTRQNLQIRPRDRLFAWKWKGRVLDSNSASDADVDIALSLILASRRFSDASYSVEARSILDDVWRKEVLSAGGARLLLAGNWASREAYPTLHPAYFAPYAYGIFADIDSRHPWRELIQGSYRVLRWIYLERRLALPPEKLYVDRASGTLLTRDPRTGREEDFGYDSVPLFWRLAVDQYWFSRRGEREVRTRALAFFRQEWARRGRILDRYSTDGKPLSRAEGLPLYASVRALALSEDPALADSIWRSGLSPSWERELSGKEIPYYLHNWIWFDRAFELGMVRSYDEFLGFLRPFDFASFALSFPWLLFAAMLALYPLARLHPWLKAAFLACAFALCARYLVWRLFHSLNFRESSGPWISVGLWGAEAYCFSTVALLLVQVGLGGRRRRATAPPRAGPAGFEPQVDVLIPIYSESLEILEKTLIGAGALRYPHRTIHVLDDSHRSEVEALAIRRGARYIRGPRKHAKAGNINHALGLTRGELVAIFDTDHIPVTSFLDETVPYFSDPGIGFVQTPHHFYNADIFQRAFLTGGRVPNEQDMFNHAIQSARDSWGGAFFVGSGAVFRRAALEQVGGFQLLSITEDIHTSQRLHAAGWRSAFVDRDLAVGLSAENLASYIVQRRRWMLGCMQIFFRDNPLFQRGLGLRHRLGYFASLYYFFFPVPRVIFWAAPLLFLLFHWHPLLAEVSVLVAYLLPYLVALPLISSALLPGWPRALWGGVYEMAVCFPLFRSIFDLLLPRSLGFKVTPKGITSERRRFDLASSRATLLAAVVTLIAIIKGVAEFEYFGIEKDAYFFNLAWASANLLLLLVALLVAWERPQRRGEERVRLALPVLLTGAGLRLEARTEEISLGGFSIVVSEKEGPPRHAWSRPEEPIGAMMEARIDGEVPVRVAVRSVGRSFLGRGKGHRYSFAMVSPDPVALEGLVRSIFASPPTWADAHRRQAHSTPELVFRFFYGILRALLPERRAKTREVAPPRLEDALLESAKDAAS